LLTHPVYLQVCGMVLLGTGLWFQSEDNSLLHKLLLYYSPVPPLTADELFSLFVIGAGASIVLLSLVGCCSACAHNRCLLCTVSQEATVSPIYGKTFEFTTKHKSNRVIAQKQQKSKIIAKLLYRLNHKTHAL